MSSLLNLKGQKFGEWEVLERDINNKVYGRGNCKPAFWICKCSCGTIKTISSSSLVHKRSTKCNNCKYKHITIPGEYWSRLLKGAKLRNHDVTITKEYIWSILQNQNFKCALSGIDISFPNKIRDLHFGKATASLDRIDSSKGYIKGNVQWVHKDVNNMKQSLSNKQFLEWCKLIYNHSKIMESKNALKKM